MDLKLCLAPMESVTGYIFRNVYNKWFGNMDCYVTPFLSPTKTKLLNHRELEDVLPEHNVGMRVIPQILTNNASLFIKTAEFLKELGYDQVNLNLGCPSGTVVSKGRGAGFLYDLDGLDAFLEEIYEGVNGRLGMDVSIKTRIGRDSGEEFRALLVLFNQYPIKMLTVHPRIQKQFYGGECDLEAFARAVRESVNPLCYNGDVTRVEDVLRLSDRFPTVGDFMIGRGILRRPDLAERIRAAAKPEGEGSIREEVSGEALRRRLRSFHDELYAGYEEIFSGDRNVLFKMKELWFYLEDYFVGVEKLLKKIRKSQRKDAYFAAVDEVFRMPLKI